MDRGLRIVPVNGYGFRVYAAGTGRRWPGLRELVGAARQVSGLSQPDAVGVGGGTRKPSRFGGMELSSAGTRTESSSRVGPPRWFSRCPLLYFFLGPTVFLGLVG